MADLNMEISSSAVDASLQRTQSQDKEIDDYYAPEFVVNARQHDWSEDFRKLTKEQVEEMTDFVARNKILVKFGEDGDSQLSGPLPGQLNEKQFIAFAIVKAHVDKVKAIVGENVLQNLEAGLREAGQLLLNISGAAGTGKSFWLKTVKRYIHTLFGHEFVMAAAPSGTAAFLIGGRTLHSMFRLPVGTSQISPLVPGVLSDIQLEMAGVGLLVIDEKSMIGHTMMAHLDYRLREIRPEFSDRPFGNFSIVLIGDFNQLPPVADTVLFCKKPPTEKNKYPDQEGFHLYREFNKSVIFDVIQRQEGDEQSHFRESLLRLGNGDFSFDDWKRWGDRSLDAMSQPEQQQFLDRGTMACARKKDMVEHNIKGVLGNNQPIAPIYAAHCHPEDKKVSADKAGNLVSSIILSKGTVFRLTTNLWVEAGLTNGSVGVVHQIIYEEGQKPPQLPVGIIATFEAYKGPPFLADVPNSVPIVPLKQFFQVGTKSNVKHMRRQLPIILGYALSIHKLQGATCDRVIVNAGEREFCAGLLLVGASRTKTYEGLAFKPFPDFSRFEQIKNSIQLEKRKAEDVRLEQLETATIAKHEVDIRQACERFAVAF